MTDYDELESLREGWDFEAKKARGAEGKGSLPKSFWQTYSAMANTVGGVIALGLEEGNDGRLYPSGIDDPDHVLRSLWDLLNNRQKVNINLLAQDDVQVCKQGGSPIIIVRIPRADRRQRPVYINGNPITGTYRRNHEGDYQCNEAEVRRMLAEAEDRPRDSLILEHYDLKDLDAGSLAAYRNLFRSNRPNHPFLASDDKDLLRQLGGWGRDRASGIEGLTLAGLIMFGRWEALRERLPYFHLDYRELPGTTVDPDQEVRWLDRVTLDGTWPGNLFEFYRRVMPRLTADLKMPFQLDASLFRRDETSVHEALREALVNSLIHADHTAQRGVRVFKQPDGFEFINPGGLRLPREQVRRGGVSDCRNPSLQQMFQMMGAGEKAGSGFPTILGAWRQQHWREPLLEENPITDETRLRLSMISLLPPATLEELEARFPGRFRNLSEVPRLALATALIEGRVTNSRMQEICDRHPRDLTFLLRDLVEQGFLETHDRGRWTWYTVAPPEASAESSVHKSSVHKSSVHKSSVHNGEDASHKEDNKKFATAVAESRRARPEDVRAAILELCRHQFRPIGELAQILERSSETLRTHYLGPMVKEGLLESRYPDRPSHPNQAYRMIQQD